MDREKCEHCNHLLIPAIGSSEKILIAGEFPGEEEIIKGIPFIGKTGDVLRFELARVGIDMMSVRLANLWSHAKNENCDLDYHVRRFMEEARNKKFILLMGSEFADVFYEGKSIMDLSGMEVRNDYFPGARVFLSVNPAYSFHGPVGELRLALRRFAEAVND